MFKVHMVQGGHHVRAYGTVVTHLVAHDGPFGHGARATTPQPQPSAARCRQWRIKSSPVELQLRQQLLGASWCTEAKVLQACAIGVCYKNARLLLALAVWRLGDALRQLAARDLLLVEAPCVDFVAC